MRVHACICEKKAVLLHAICGQTYKMRKKIVFSLVALMALALTSCEKQEYHAQTFDLVVMQPDWKWDSDTKQFYYSFNVPYITRDVYNFGTITVSREFNNGTADAYQVALPMSTYLYDEIVDENDSVINTVYYTQHIDYRFGVGYVDIQLTNSDYYYEEKNPESMVFRLQLVY